MDVSAQDKPAACFKRCAQTDGCKAWVHQSCADGSRCHLKSSVPPQQFASAESCCQTTSGVRDAAQSLVPLKFKPLRLGQVKVDGWLRDQLVVMANGLSGHLHLFWNDVKNSVWIGGTDDKSGAGHERGPYWLNGMVPLAAHLNATGDIGSLDVDVNEQVNYWVAYILDHQLPSGWLGPDDGFGGAGNTYWNGWNTAAALLQYADAMGLDSPMGKLCTKAVLDYVAEVHRRMLQTPTTTWTQNRWQDWAYIVHWLMDVAPQGQEQMLWDAAELTHEQSWDWDAYYAQTGVGTQGAYKGKVIPKFPKSNVGGWTMWDHGVNNAMGTKSSHTWYRQSRNASELLNAYTKVDMQDRYHGQPHGIFSADECFGGRDLNRGIELCAIVEQMYSLQHMFRVDGDGAWLDRMERIAYNALPGTITADSWQHQYLQQANEINALYQTSPHVWQTDGDASTGFGVDPNFGCCTANMQQGWPKLASNIFLEAEDGSLLIALLLPASVTYNGAIVDMSASDFPFADDVEIKVSGAVKLQIRIPSWADQAEISVNDGARVPTKNGTLHAVTCTDSTRISLFLNPVIRVETGWGSDAKTIEPCVYDPNGATMSTADATDFVFASNEVDEGFLEVLGIMVGGAGPADSKKAGVTDIRSGNPGEVTSAAVAHPIASQGHYISSVSFTYQYVAGYGAAGAPGGSTLSLVLVDSQTGLDVQSLYSSPPLADYFYDFFTGYSPAVVTEIKDLRVDCQHAMQMVLRFQNNQRNLQIPLDTLKITIGWSTDVAPGPHDPPPQGVPATNAAAVLRGALLYALPLEEQTSVVKVWQPFNNTDLDMTTTSPWNFALRFDGLSFAARKPVSGVVPWDTRGIRSVITATGCAVSDWKESCNAAAEPRSSPIEKDICGKTTSLTLVPYGSTNLRMGALPWVGSGEVIFL